jgi:aspartate aminotransferase
LANLAILRKARGRAFRRVWAAVRVQGVREISDRVAGVKDWRAAMHDRLGRLQSAASDLLLTGGGEWSSDIEMPEHLLAAAADAVRRRPQYTHEYGLLPLREAIAAKLAAENGIDVDPGSEVMVTTSATEAINVTLRTLLRAGDELITGDPYYLSIYEPNVKLCGAAVRSVQTIASRHFRINLEGVEAAIGPRTRLLLVTSPENPTGAVVDPDSARRLAEIAIRNDLWVISDELYERFVYDERVHTSIASLPGMRERTVTIQGFSKTYGLTGYRVAYLAGPRDLVRQISKVHYATTLCASEVSQRVALAALTGPQDWLAPIVAAYSKAREILVRGLDAIPGMSCSMPDGAIYAFPDIRSFGLDSMAMTEYLIEKSRVANRPGSYFGAGGEGFVRFNVPPNPVVADEVVRRVAEALDEVRVAVGPG